MRLVRTAVTGTVIGALAVMMGGCPSQAPEALVGGAVFESDLTGKVGPSGTGLPETVAPLVPPPVETGESGPAPSGSVEGPVPSVPVEVAEPNVPILTSEQPGPFDPGDLPPLEPDPQLPYGTWLLESGGALAGFIEGLATFSETADVTALTLSGDGTGTVFMRDRLTGAKDCLRVFALFDGDELVLDFAAERATDFVFNTGIDETTFFFPVVVAEDDMLGLAGVDGQIALFSRQDELPDAVRCGELEVLDTFENLPAPQFFSDLVLFDGDLIFNSGVGQIESFDLAADALVAPLGPTSSRLVQTAQGGFFWTHCGCGGSRDAFRRTLSSVVDTVSSEGEMGGAITFRAMAYNATTDRLWLHGRRSSDSFGRFFVMNTNGEPDVVEQEISFNRDLRGLTFDGNNLWGIVTVGTQSVVQIDATTGQVLETYQVPDQDVSWSGLEIAGGQMYLLGTTLDAEGVLYRVTIP